MTQQKVTQCACHVRMGVTVTVRVERVACQVALFLEPHLTVLISDRCGMTKASW